VAKPWKEISEYIHTHLTGCQFVGISRDNEVFIELEYDVPEMENGAALRIKREFPYISKVIVVVQPSEVLNAEILQVVGDLNKVLDSTSPKTEDLLEIKRLE
jgi:hypothetical protein